VWLKCETASQRALRGWQRRRRRHRRQRADAAAEAALQAGADQGESAAVARAGYGSDGSGSEGGGGGSWGPLREVDSGDSAETLDSPSGSDVEEHWRLQKPWLTRARYDMSRTSAIARQVRDCRFVLPAWWYRLGGL
jgi:hypothetical protein